MANTLSGQAAGMSADGSSNVGTGSTIDAIGAGKTAQNPDQSLTVNRNQLTQWVLDQLQRLRNFRRPYDQRRAYFYRQYIGQRDRRLYPDNITPRSNTFVPYASSNVETFVSRVHDAFFSMDPPIEARAKGGSEDSADKMILVMLTCFKRANWIKQLELCLRDCGIYGHFGIKVDWDWDYDIVNGPDPVFAMMPVMDQTTGQPKMGADGKPMMVPVTDQEGNKQQIGTQMVSKQVPRNCPKLIPIDIYDLLIDPDGKMKAHVMEISWGEMKRQAETNPELYYPEALAELTRRLSQYKDLDRDGIIIRMAEMWNDTDKTTTLVTFGEDADAIGWKDRRYQYRNASYSAYKRRVYNGPPVLLYTGPNPFAHKRIPILDCPYIKVKGDAWGIGLIEKISDLNEAVNVFTNMITDNWNISINRRFAYDVSMDIDHDQLDQGNTPGGKIGVVGNPSEAIFPLPNYTPNEQDYQIIDLYRGMIEQSSGITEYATGMAQNKGTAAGISQVINESGYIFKLFIRNFELEVLQPLCEMVCSLIQQYGTDEMEYSITNEAPGIPKYGQVKLSDLIGNYSFDFVGANYATGKVVKQRNLMAFYNIAMNTPYANQGEFIREIAKCMEIPNAKRLVKSDQQVQQETAQQSQTAIEQEVLRELLKFESKALVAGIAKKEPNQGVTDHAMAVQQEVEQFLLDTAGVPVETLPSGEGRGAGNPARNGNLETPGGDVSDQMRGFSQSNGGNALGAG